MNVASQNAAPIAYNYGAGVRELSVSVSNVQRYKAVIACGLGQSGFDYYILSNGNLSYRAAGADNGYFYITQSGGTFTAHSYRYATSTVAIWVV